jgi:CheY-like chemotaxis protein
MQTKKILIVDDDAINALVFKKYLGQMYEVSSAQGVQEALEVLARETFDLLLMDVELGDPELDGIDLLQQVRLMPGHETVPAIATTSHLGRENAQRLAQAGFTAYFPKPVERDLLLREMARILA